MLSSIWLLGEESVHKSRRTTGFDPRPDMVIVTDLSFDGSGVFDAVRGYYLVERLGVNLALAQTVCQLNLAELAWQECFVWTLRMWQRAEYALVVLEG